MIPYPGQYAPFVLSGRSRSRAETTVPLRHYRLIAVGEYPHEVSGQTLHSGAVYWIQPGQQPKLKCPPADESHSVDFIIISSRLEPVSPGRSFRLSDSEAAQPTPEQIWNLNLPMILPERLWSWALVRLQLITSIWWRGDLEHFQANMQLTDLLERMVTEQLQNRTRSSPSKQNWFFSVERAVEERIASILTVSDMAGIAGLSTAHFSRRFHEVMREPPAAWLRRRRLEAAALLLRSSSKSIQEIAKEVGFRRPSAFNLAWKREYQCSPGAWRGNPTGKNADT